MLRYAIAVSLVLAAPAAQAASSPNETIVLAGGCFWGMEGTFEHVKGVKSVVSGFAGGTAASATYAQVSTEQTGHAEAVKVVFNPAEVSLTQILSIYFTVAHDPTQLNRQYPDEGPSYRSAIFPQSSAQRAFVEAYVRSLNAKPSFKGRIVTRIESGPFYPAEAYHQDFMRRNPDHPYIKRWDVPRIARLRATYPALYRGW